MSLEKRILCPFLYMLLGIALVTGTARSSLAATSLSGVVQNSAGATMTGAVIEKAGEPSIATTSSEDGSFTLEGLPTATNYTLRISYTGHSPTYDTVEYNTPLTPVIDDFDRADEGPPLSTSWLEGWGGGFKVISQRAASTTAASPNTTIYDSGFAANQEVYFTVAVKPTGNNTTSVGAYLRMDLARLNGYLVTYVPQSGTDTIRFWRMTNGAATRLGADIPCEFSAGDKFRVTAEGDLFSIYQYRGENWKLVATRTETTYRQGGLIGIYGAGNTGAVDDFGGGTLPDSNALNLSVPLVLYPPEEVAAWGIAPDKGVIAGTVLDEADSTNPLSGAVVTATSLLHPAQPYPVVYSDGARLGGTATLANGIYKVLNVDDGDTVTISATKQGWTFGRRSIAVHGGGVSQGSIYGRPVSAPPIATNDPTALDPGGASGNVATNPNKVSFGNVALGKSSPPVTITYTNNGPGPVTIYRSYYNGDTTSFSFRPGGPQPCPELRGTFAAGASCTYVGIFTPLTEGAKMATHLLVSGSIDMPVYSLTLNGTGVK